MSHKNRQNPQHPSVLHPDNSRFAFDRDDMDEAEDYLSFASNGMTDNERIDEFNYYDHYLSVDPEGPKTAKSSPDGQN